MAAREQPQLALDERVVDDDLLEQSLERRERAKAAAGKARKAYKQANDSTRAYLERHELGESPLRVGRFVIVAREVDGRAVSFETSPVTRITIRVDKEPAP